MLQRFLNFAEQARLFSRSSRVLLAVSGGVDSMVMASLFRESGTAHAIAHCNFSLRGEESDGDEKFVAAYAAEYGIPFFTRRFDTMAHAATEKISVQMAARELRYEWFSSLVSLEGYDAVAVAHNLNDNVETFLINLLRGTGINGLTGMSQHHNGVIRPLLFATRDEIAAFASENRIVFREDSSNAQVKYTRNRIRHLVIPEMEKVNPGAINAMTDTMKHLASDSQILDFYIGGLRESLFRSAPGGVSEVEIKDLLALKPLAPHIYGLFKKFGLSPGQIDEVIALLGSQTGRYLCTTTHRLLCDRGRIIIARRDEEEPADFNFSSLDEMRMSGLFTELRIMEPSDDPLPVSPLTACLDLDRISFPVTVRTWGPGDRFMPLGMKQMKKISDFLIDMKIPVTAKEKVLLLLSGDEVMWVMGYRIDDRFRVTGHSEKILVLTV
ncbi:tRNA lysidine(34) synthetase TilS [bacterium]|nr:tRNA lysidine(34) synthetase TilS [bacterium]